MLKVFVLWYLGCCNEGGVLAYLGDSDEEECIFIVKALSSSYSELLDNAPKLNPDLNYSCFETVLLPWKDSADSIKTERLHVMGQHFSHFMKDPYAPMGLGRTKSTSTEFHVLLISQLESF